MRRWRDRFVPSAVLRLTACLAVAAMLGGCAGGGDRVFGYRAFASDAASDLPAGRTLSHLTYAQEEAIIGQAIAAHEMRRP